MRAGSFKYRQDEEAQFSNDVWKTKRGYKSIKLSAASMFNKLRLDTHLAGVNKGNTYGKLR